MRRRDFIALLGNAAAWPLAARAQSSVPVVGYLDVQSPAGFEPYVGAFRQGLKEAGFVEGQNVAIEYRWAELQYDRLPALAADLVRRGVAVIAVPGGSPAALAAKQATATIPIVFQMGLDPVRLGLVASMNRPGGNITGISNITPGLAGKRLELLHKLVPNAEKIAVLIPTTVTSFQEVSADLQEAGCLLGVQVVFLPVTTERDFEPAFRNLVEQRAGALLLTDGILFNNHREQLVGLAARYSVPAMYTFPEFAAAGGLVSYASSLKEAYRLTGAYAGRILKGDKPANLPVLQPTKFELVINLKTAKAIGLPVPDTLLALADEVIE